MRRISIVVLSFLSVVIMAWGVLYLSRIHIMNYHVAYLAMTEEQLMEVDDHIVPLFLVLMKITGSCMLAIGATTLVVTLGPVRKRQRWGWWSLITLLPVPLMVTTWLTYQVSSQISMGPRPPYWLSLGILIVFIAFIGFCHPVKGR